jgi:hypothetical protein
MGTEMPEQAPWTVDAYETEQGERPALSFLQGLEGRNESEAVALVKLLQERGNSLRRPQSGALGEGLFELRGKESGSSRCFSRTVWRCSWMARSRSGMTSPKTLERVRGYQKEVVRRKRGSRQEKER